ncbi:MAG: hypothetical protein QNJ22_02245 [Desulfosarcinaceae bacterium]|nr:hypothetical protein [Desulfosarcinaceae bacterium]
MKAVRATTGVGPEHRPEVGERTCARFFGSYGHPNRDRLPRAGDRYAAGEGFAEIGDFHENGNWFYHIHLQVLTELGLSRGDLSNGYCVEEDLGAINDICPSPIPLFRRT